MLRLVLLVLSIGGAALALSSCSVATLNFLVPKGGFTVTRDIAYGSDPRQKLDIYRPKNKPGPLPVVVFFYGGSWQNGSKADYLFAGQAFASKGYIAVLADYRVYPQVHFPAFLEDGASAFAWVHDHIGEYGGDTARLYLAGHSAGAYIAVMLSVDTPYLAQAGARREWVKGVIGISGPYDFLPFTDPKIIALFSTAPGPQTQPVNYIGYGLPPMFLATGEADTTVYPRNTVHLAKKLREHGDRVETHFYPGVAHIGIALSLATGFRYKAPLLDDIAAFIDGSNTDVE